jgi:hypothetical protein
MGTRGSFHRGNKVAKVENMWSYTSTSPHIYMMWCLIKVRVKVSLCLIKMTGHNSATKTLTLNPRLKSGYVPQEELNTDID